MTDRWLLERVLGSPSGCGPRVITAHWVSPDASRACVVTADGYAIETDLRTFNERVSRVCEQNELVRHAQFLVGASPRLVTLIERDGEVRPFLHDLDHDSARRALLDRPLGSSEAAGSSVYSKQSLDGSLFVALAGTDLALFDREGTPLRDAFIEASFRSATNVVLSASRVARIIDGDLTLSNFNGTDEVRVFCGLAHSEERLSLVPAGPSFVAIRRQSPRQYHCTLVDLDARRSTHFSDVYIEQGWHYGGCVADEHGLMVSERTLRCYEVRGAKQYAELDLWRSRVAALTNDSLVVFAHGQWSIVPRESASWAQRTSQDHGAFARVAIDDRGAVVAQDDDHAISYWSPSQPTPITTERTERYHDAPHDRLLAFAEGASSIIVLRSRPRAPHEARLRALCANNGQLEERWSTPFARVDECWIDDEAQVFIGSNRSSSAIVRTDRSSAASVLTLTTPCTGSLRFEGEREFDVINQQYWARCERIEDTFVERERVARNELRRQPLVASSNEPGDTAKRAYAYAFETPRGIRVAPAFSQAKVRCSRDNKHVALVLGDNRSIAAGVADGRALDEWLAVDPSDPLDTICALALSPNASRIAVGTARGTIRVFRRPDPPPQSSTAAPR
ncbi:MAG: hypothetical protein U0269_28865 [Polyangiales bacterium]